MSKRKGMIFAAIERLDSLMAIGESRREAKIAIRNALPAGEKCWSVSSGKIHSYITRQGYQQHVLHFLNWCRNTYDLHRLDHVDERAEELASAYLTMRIEHKKSPYTLQAERSALRLFFQNDLLATDVALPKRLRGYITRSRHITKQDVHFQPENWPELLAFLTATGIRREEVMALFGYEICIDTDIGDLVIYVRNGKGGKSRVVHILPGHEHAVLQMKEQRPEIAHVFEHVPKDLDVHSYRRVYAQMFYKHLSGRELPPQKGRLKPHDYDRQAALYVSQQLGHERVSVVMTNYIR